MSKSVTLLLILVILTTACLSTVCPINAESETIIVPDDYPTIAAAIGNATQGDTVYVKKGTYEEKTLEITKPLSLIGEDAEFTQINLDPPLYKTEPNIIGQSWSYYGSAITVNTNDFKLSDLTITTTVPSNKAGGGVSITGNRTQIIGNSIPTGVSVNGSYCNITGNTFLKGVSLYGSHGNVSENNIIGSGGIYIFGVYNSVFSNNINGQDNMGIHLEGASCMIYGNHVAKNSGIGGIYISSDETIVAKNFVDHSNIGIKVGGSDNIICANNVTNNKVGLVADSRIYNYWKGAVTDSEGSNNFYANYVANNVVGADIDQYSDNNVTSIFYHNNFVDNTFQVETADYDDAYGNDSFDNGEEGNYWSDYTGTEVDGDGIGDTPYVIDANRQDRFPLMTPFDVSSETVELPEWMAPLSVLLVSPENATYTADVSLNFTVNKQTSWLGYSLDGADVVTVSGNITLSGLSSGLHNVTVYAEDMFGNSVTSETFYFTIAEPFPVVPVAAASGVAVAVVGVGLLVYFKKRKH